VRDKDDDWATPALRDAASRRRATRPYISEPELRQGTGPNFPRIPHDPRFPSLFSEREKRTGRRWLAGFIGLWLVSTLVCMGIVILLAWAIVSYLNRH
jgi:hypothetical protein